MVAKRTTSRAVKRVAKSVTAVGASGGSAAADIRAAVGTSTSPTSTGTKAVTGVGFQPKVVMPFGVPGTVDGSNTEAMLGFGCGLSTSSRGSISVSSDHGVATSNADRRHDDTKAFSVLDSGVVYEAADLSSLDSDGFTLNWTTAAAAANILNHICLGGDDLEASLTLHQMNGTNADESFAHGLTGGAPDALLFFGIGETGLPPTTSANAKFDFGSWAGGSQFAASVQSQNGVSTTSTSRVLSNTEAYLTQQVTSTKLRSFAVSGVDATNVDVSYVVTTSTGQFRFFVLALRGCKAQVGTFDANGSTSAVNIACTGITPKLFMPILLPGGVDNINTVQTGTAFTIGAGDGTNAVSCGITDEHNVATTNARRCQDSTGVSEYDFDGTLETDAAISFSGESVNYTPSTNTGTTWGQGGYIIIGN